MRRLARLLSPLMVAVSAHAAVPIAWTVNPDRPSPKSVAYYRGETLHLTPTYTGLLLSANTAVSMYFRTSATQTVWYVASQPGVRVNSTTVRQPYTPADDAGQSWSEFYVLVEDQGVNYRANGYISYIDSPGYSPTGALTAVTMVDWSKLSHVNLGSAPFLVSGTFPTYAQVTNIAEAVVSAATTDDTPNLPWESIVYTNTPTYTDTVAKAASAVQSEADNLATVVARGRDSAGRFGTEDTGVYDIINPVASKEIYTGGYRGGRWYRLGQFEHGWYPPSETFLSSTLIRHNWHYFGYAGIGWTNTVENPLSTPVYGMMLGGVTRTTWPTEGVSAHDALTSLGWTESGHTGTAARVAIFSEGGAAGYGTLGENLSWDGDTINASGVSASTATNIAETVFAEKIANVTTNDLPGIDWDSLGGGTAAPLVLNLSGLLIYDAAGSNLHFEVEIATNSAFAASTRHCTTNSVSGWEYFNGSEYAAFPEAGLPEAYHDIDGKASVIFKPGIASSSHYVRARAWNGLDWSDMRAAHGSGTIRVGAGAVYADAVSAEIVTNIVQIVAAKPIALEQYVSTHITLADAASVVIPGTAAQYSLTTSQAWTLALTNGHPRYGFFIDVVGTNSMSFPASWRVINADYEPGGTNAISVLPYASTNWSIFAVGVN